MLVFNLTDKGVVYKGKHIPPNGGSVEISNLSFIPNRDLALQDAKVLAFGQLPKWWIAKTSRQVESPILRAPVVTVSQVASILMEAMDKKTLGLSEISKSERKKK